MVYLLIKSAHLSAVMTFVGGLLMLSVAVGTPNLAVQRVIRRWDRRVTVPALLIVWVTGMTMAMQGHWFGQPWLTLKLVLVVCLSALHGVLAGTSRRMERASATMSVPGILRVAGMVTIAVVAVIVLLVTLKDV